MTWKEFKDKVEHMGVKDSDSVVTINEEGCEKIFVEISNSLNDVRITTTWADGS